MSPKLFVAGDLS